MTGEEGMMKLYEIIFSPTGGTKKVADIITDRFRSESSLIDLTDSFLDFSLYSFSEEDVCIVAVPSYGGRIPGVAGERLKQMRGNKAKVVSVTVYGNRAYDDTMLELNDTLIESGFCPVAAIAAVAEHSIMRQFAAGRPDEEDRRELVDFTERIKRGLQNGSLTETPAVPGKRPFRSFDGVPMKPRTGKSCTKCGICAEKCPVGAIPSDMPMSTYHDRCITCMRCITVCPQKNRSISKVLVAAGAQKLKKACRERKKNELYL
jgi:ferredoxin